jgi:hypothetical protein
MSTKNKFRTATETPYKYYNELWNPVIFGADEIYNVYSFRHGVQKLRNHRDYVYWTCHEIDLESKDPYKYERK